MKKNIVFSCFLVTLFLAGSAFAGSTLTANNFSAMSTVQLSHLRHKMRASSPQEKEKFEMEWQKRLRAMPKAIREHRFPDEVLKSSREIKSDKH